MNACLVCLGPIESDAAGDACHPQCAKKLVGLTRMPVAAGFGPATRRATLPATTSRIVRPGDEPTCAVDISADTRRLEVAPEIGRFILKSQSAAFAELPENELLTMRLAELVRIGIPPCGLVRLPDQSLAFLVRRHDGPDDGAAWLREDFCQLAGRPPDATHDGSAELCADLIRRCASEPLVALMKLYRLMVFAWWTGNGNLHLGSLALVTGPDDVRGFAPARDLVCTRLAIPGDPLALPVGGKRDRLARADWLRYGDTCGLRPRVVERVLATIVSSFDEALELVSRSFLTEEAKGAYAELLGRRTALLERR